MPYEVRVHHMRIHALGVWGSAFAIFVCIAGGVSRPEGASGSDPALRELLGWVGRTTCMFGRPREPREGEMREDVIVL